MRFGVALQARYEYMGPITRAAEELGFESVWIPDHLVLPAVIGELSPIKGETHPPIDPTIPTYDNLMYLVHLAGQSTTIRLGTWVYNLALRHPLVAARACQTLDILSGGRFLLGVGAGWIPGEYEAAGVDFPTRGRRLDECIDVLRILWSEDEPSYRGEFFDIGPVRFEPKPTQGRIPIHVGGDSDPALRRAVARGDGWIGSWHTPETARACVDRLHQLMGEVGRDPEDLELTVSIATASVDELEAFRSLGVDRLIVAPWGRSREAVEGLERFSELVTGWQGPIAGP